MNEVWFAIQSEQEEPYYLSEKEIFQLMLESIRRIDSGELELAAGKDGRHTFVFHQSPIPARDNGKGVSGNALLGLVKQHAANRRDAYDRFLEDFFRNDARERGMSDGEFEKLLEQHREVKTNLTLSMSYRCATCGNANEVNSEQVGDLYFICSSCNGLNHLTVCRSCDSILISANRHWDCERCGVHSLFRQSSLTGRIAAALFERDGFRDIAESGGIPEEGRQLYFKISEVQERRLDSFREFEAFLRRSERHIVEFCAQERHRIAKFLVEWNLLPQKILNAESDSAAEALLAPMISERLADERFEDEVFTLIKELCADDNKLKESESVRRENHELRVKLREYSTDFPIESKEIYKLAERLSGYHGQKLHAEDVRRWLCQFAQSEIESAFSILKAVEFFSEADCEDFLYAALRQATRLLYETGFRVPETENRLEAMAKEVEHFRKYEKSLRSSWRPTSFIGTDPTTSESTALRHLKRATGLSATPIELLLKQQPSSPPVVLFADFIAGTGQQAVELYQQTAEMLENASDYWRDAPRILILVAATKAAIRRIRSATNNRLSVFAGRVFEKRDMAFHVDSKKWASTKAREDAKKLASRIGEQLEPKHPLGYGEGQMLVAFHHNCPNNTLPIIWKQGKVNGIPWFSLFPRK